MAKKGMGGGEVKGNVKKTAELVKWDFLAKFPLRKNSAKNIFFWSKMQMFALFGSFL